MKRSFLPFLFLAAAALPAQGGDKAVVEPPPLLSGGLSMGYDTAYLFRGANYGDDAVWAGADFNLTVRPNLLINFGLWYVNPTADIVIVDDELDLYSYVVVPLGDCWELAAGGTWYYYPEEEADAAELGLTLSRKIFDFCKFSFEYVYDLDAEGNYFGYYLDKVIEVCDNLDLTLGAGISHADHNYDVGRLAGDRAYVQGGLTYHLTESLDVNAYMLGNFPLDELDARGEKEDLYGGLSMTVSF